MEAFQKNQEARAVVCGPGQERRIMASAGGLMVAEIRFESGAGGGLPHTHPHRQVSYVVSGKFAYEIDGDERELYPGDAVMVEPGLPHGCRCLEAGTLIDVFTPERQDFLSLIE